MQVLYIPATNNLQDVVLLNVESISEIHRRLGGLSDFTPLGNNVYMWFNEDGRDSGLVPNGVATDIYSDIYGETNVIVGDIILTGGFSDLLIGNVLDLLNKRHET